MTTAPDGYGTVATCLFHIDWRLWGDLVGEDERPISSAVMIDTNGTYFPILDRARLAASGEIESACLKGGRYTPERLLALTGAAAIHLERLVALGMTRNLFQRKDPSQGGRDNEMALTYLESLEKLNKGEWLFGDPASNAAMIPSLVKYPKTVSERIPRAFPES